MTVDRQHHKSKKKQYTIILVPDEDSSKARNFRFVLWQLLTGMMVFAVLIVAAVLLALTYTPVGQLFPLSNTGLEKKYSRELVSLNQRMMNMMQQLIELRAYNFKLRKVLGENVTIPDSGFVITRPGTDEKTDVGMTSREIPASAAAKQTGQDQQQAYTSHSLRVGTYNQFAISFPAIFPTEGYITRGFEPEKNHYGLDIAGKVGSLIIAAADGNIVFSGWTYDDGYVIIISHAGGFMSFYKHNQSLLKSTGSFVRRGEPIATLGNSGITSSGPHLHFEIWKDGVPVDPSIYMINLNL